MRIVAQRTLQAFWETHPETETSLRLWLAVARAAQWRSMADVQSRWPKAKVLNGERVRFQICWIKFVGTHAEYDRVDALTVDLYREARMEPRPIHDERDYETALREIRRLWDAVSPADVRRLADWGALVDLYETGQMTVPAGLDPVAVIQAEMEMNGRTRADLAALLGQNRATEILGRKRPLTLPMIRRLHREWGIPAEMLIAEYEMARA